MGQRAWDTTMQPAETARATSSLPVPDSPVMSTVLLVGAMVSTSWKMFTIASLLPMMFEN